MTPHSPDPVLEEYKRLAADYDRRWSFYVEASVQETLARFSVSAEDRILDVGCGTGVLLSRLCGRVPPERLCGLDLCPEMLAVARSRLNKGVLVRTGCAEEIPFEDETFTVVVSTNAFHYFLDAERALREMLRVLRSGGRLVITDWCDDYAACKICVRVLRLWSCTPIRIYGRQDCADLLENAGVQAVRVDRYRVGWVWGLMTAVGTKA